MRGGEEAEGTAVNCSVFKLSFVWNRVQKSEDFGLQ